MMQELFREVLGVQVETPFPRMTYDEAMSLYGSDKPDLRFQMTIDITQTVSQPASLMHLEM